MSGREVVKVTPPDQVPGLINAIGLWAEATTSATSDRRLDLLRDKALALLEFFDYVKKHPNEVTAIDVKAWQAELEMHDLAPATVYAKISRLSSWYEWAMKDPELAKVIRFNPVKLARPKAPRAYQTAGVKALSDDQMSALLNAVKTLADAGELIAKRDYALLLFYFTTGMRRAEVIRLKWGDLSFKDEAIEILAKFKGGTYRSVEARSPRARQALLDYLRSAGRLARMKPHDPLWIRHDRAARACGAGTGGQGEALTSHGFAKNLKQYALAAGIGDMHLHQTRHTYARKVAEKHGVNETQEALGHKNRATTMIYIERISVKRDKHGQEIDEGLNLGD